MTLSKFIETKKELPANSPNTVFLLKVSCPKLVLRVKNAAKIEKTKNLIDYYFWSNQLYRN